MQRVDATSLRRALAAAWCAQTAYRQDWTADNPTRNQCAVTALVVQDHLGGTIVRGAYLTSAGEKGTHYWNLIDGTELDMTRDQFLPTTQIDRLSLDHPRETILQSPDTAARYALLKGRAAAALKG